MTIMKLCKRTKPFKGKMSVPGDKSISHRSIMIGAIAEGTTRIRNFLNGDDCLSTIGCFRRLGVQIDVGSDEILVHGKGLYGLCAPSGALDVGNSGTTTRLICGILAGQDFTSTLSGDASLNRRPMNRIIEPLCAMGAHISSVEGNGCAPLSIHPGQLKGIRYDSKIASAQVKSAILLAGLYAKGETTVTEPVLSRDHTERMLKSFGADIDFHSPDTHSGRPAAIIRPCEALFSQDITVPGDISSAAYFIAAALLIPGSELLITGVGVNSTRAGFLEVLKNMGADITYLNRKSMGGEPAADLLVRYSSLTGTTVEGALIPALIDEVPILAVLAAYADGVTVIRDAAELRVKETDRIQTVTENLQSMGGHITPTADGMIIEGTGSLHGAQIQSRLDHRIAMAFSIAAMAADGETDIFDSHCADISYPGFYETLKEFNART